ncbi:MAG: GDSL-type esterase/lipase family protein, partial [Candidatus Thorarchaeota archaeon]|nr:GDSL-type esterase/lipase family protein [Candidatus Thorarchaeota archaeon]
VQSQYGFWILESARNEGITTLQFQNQGIPGQLASEMKLRLRKLLERNDYDVVVIMAGSNDLGWGHRPDDVFDVLSHLWNESTSKGIKTIACTIPPIGSRIPQHQEKQRRLNDRILREGCHIPQLLLADVFWELADKEGILIPEYNSGDGLHLSVEGYRRIGEILWENVIRNLV